MKEREKNEVLIITQDRRLLRGEVQDEKGHFLHVDIGVRDVTRYERGQVIHVRDVLGERHKANPRTFSRS